MTVSFTRFFWGILNGLREPKVSRYLNGWFCAECSHDNPDEQSPCADLTECNNCGAPRP